MLHIASILVAKKDAAEVPLRLVSGIGFERLLDMAEWQMRLAP